jgi:predicted RNA binding protein YcfA (HicA-like mRNA interferase family)
MDECQPLLKLVGLTPRARGHRVDDVQGSHAKLRHPDGRVVIVPLHRTLARGTLGSILG